VARSDIHQLPEFEPQSAGRAGQTEHSRALKVASDKRQLFARIVAVLLIVFEKQPLRFIDELLLPTSKGASGLLLGLRQHAIFLTGISFSWGMVRSWGFWGDPLAYPEWIGPRHTNYPDGSICAFEPADGTWALSDPIVKLLDIYTLWAVRHLHLQVFGRWPGREAVHHPAERVIELRADEYCGCARSDKLYGECCMPKDLARDRIRDALTFFWRSGGFRNPPDAISHFVRDRKEPPRLGTLFPTLAQWITGHCLTEAALLA